MKPNCPVSSSVIAARELYHVHPSLFTRAVLAPVPVLVDLVPAHTIGTLEQSLYEGTLAHTLVALLALPLCALAYMSVVYVMLVLGTRLYYRVISPGLNNNNVAYA